MLRRACISTVLVALALAACSSGSSDSAATTTTVPATTTTVAPTTTTTPLQPQPDPTAAATVLLDAWKAGDVATAETVASPAVVQSLFATGTPTTSESRGCSDAKYDPAQCVYRTDLGELQIRTTMQGDGWVVDQARVTADG